MAGLAKGWGQSGSSYVGSDWGRLKRVLVHTPGEETRRGLDLGYGPVRFLGGTQDPKIGEEHLEMVRLLQASGAEVITIRGALEGAIQAARGAKALQGWLRSWNPPLAAHADRVDASVLLGTADEFLYRKNDDGEFAPLTDPAASFYWTRDSAVMTPKGVILCRFSNEARAVESALARFLYEWSPELKRYPILFDASEEELALEGGDTMVVDARTLFVGVGNRSDEKAAKRLARKLGMDVVAVRLPSRGRGPLNGMFLHLDTVCCFVDAKTVVTLPYLFEKEYAGKDPLSFMLRGLAAKPKARDQNLDQMLPELARMGEVTKYKAGSGEKEDLPSGIKLVDYLRGQGVRIVTVGGPAQESGREKHFTETVLREFRRQAANVVAVAPGKVLAYAGNPRTQKALEEAGIEVQTFGGQEIMRHNGGPHCLTQPLERT
jgi:arginine deiminase